MDEDRLDRLEKKIDVIDRKISKSLNMYRSIQVDDEREITQLYEEVQSLKNLVKTLKLG